MNATESNPKLKAKKPSKNLPLDPLVVGLAEEMQRQDMRPSLTNELEFLIVGEAKRRGMIDEAKARSILSSERVEAGSV